MVCCEEPTWKALWARTRLSLVFFSKHRPGKLHHPFPLESFSFWNLRVFKVSITLATRALILVMFYEPRFQKKRRLFWTNPRMKRIQKNNLQSSATLFSSPPNSLKNISSRPTPVWSANSPVPTPHIFRQRQVPSGNFVNLSLGISLHRRRLRLSTKAVMRPNVTRVPRSRSSSNDPPGTWRNMTGRGPVGSRRQYSTREV